MTKKTEIEALNALFFLLVVFIHVSSEPIRLLDRQSIVFGIMMALWQLASVVMQGFVFLSGLKLFLGARKKFSYPGFILRRFIKIYLPFVLWTIIYYLYFWQREYYELNLFKFGRYLLIGNIVSPFYFIIVIMQFYLLMPLWRLIVRKVIPKVAIPAALVIMIIMKKIQIPYNDRIFTTYLLYWVLGCYAGYYYNDFKTRISGRTGHILISVVAVTAVFDVYFKYRSMVYGVYIPYLENIHLLYTAAMILTLANLFSNYQARLLQRISCAGFTVFLTHVLFINIIDERMNFYGIGKLSVRFGIRFVFVYALSLLTGLIWYNIKKVKVW